MENYLTSGSQLIQRFFFSCWLAFFVSQFGVVSWADADGEKHTLHGTWVLNTQSDMGLEREYVLTLQPSGEFHLMIKETSPLAADTFFDAEGEEDGEEMEGWASWEEFIAEVDVNNNGVADEEDYEAAREPEDEESWDEVLAMFGDENGDRVIDQAEYERLAGGYDAAMDLEAEYEEWMEEVFGETMVTTTSIRGTWEASEFDITLTRGEVEYGFNELTLEEYYTYVIGFSYRMMVLQAEQFDQEAMTEEMFYRMVLADAMDGEGNPIEVSESASVDQLREAVVENMMQLFVFLADKPAEFGMETENFVLSMSDDGTTLTHSDRSTLVFTRLDVNSAVEATSWGHIKALYR